MHNDSLTGIPRTGLFPRRYGILQTINILSTVGFNLDNPDLHGILGTFGRGISIPILGTLEDQSIRSGS